MSKDQSKEKAPKVVMTNIPTVELQSMVNSVFGTKTNPTPRVEYITMDKSNRESVIQFVKRITYNGSDEKIKKSNDELLDGIFKNRKRYTTICILPNNASFIGNANNKKFSIKLAAYAAVKNGHAHNTEIAENEVKSDKA